jgi:hypothetical protein
MMWMFLMATTTYAMATPNLGQFAIRTRIHSDIIRHGSLFLDQRADRQMGGEAHQGEVGLVIGDEYLAFRDFSKE